MASRRDILGDFIQMQLHRFGVALGQDRGRPPCPLSDRSRRRYRSRRCAGRSALRDRVPRLAQRRVILFFWPDARLVGKPDFNRARIDVLFPAPISSRRAGKLF